jgi:nitrite reductase/ring-hydroxylating ferredoxin subunit
MTARRIQLGPSSFMPSRGFVVVPVFPPCKLPDGTTARSALIGRSNGVLRAYANVCRHLAIPLDLAGDGEVMDDDRIEIVCHHHGARFDGADGACVYGPCFGRSLWAFRVEVDALGDASLVLEVAGGPGDGG